MQIHFHNARLYWLTARVFIYGFEGVHVDSFYMWLKFFLLNFNNLSSFKSLNLSKTAMLGFGNAAN